MLANAAREGARVASLPAYTTTDVETRINEYLQAGGLPATPTITVTTTTIPYGTGTWPATTVNVAYTHSYMFVGGFVGWFGGTFSPDVTIGAQATMRHELGS